MTFRKRLFARETVIGSFVTVPGGGFVEIVGLLGFDFVVIDMEHAGLDMHQTEDLIRAAQIRDCVPLVRVTTNQPHYILRALDCGAVGVHVPDVTTNDDARAAVESAKYGPRGRRGLASVRAADYGLGGPLHEYTQRANDETVVIAHIESRESVESLDELLSVDGIDVYYLGPVDLSNDLGIPGKTKDERVMKLVEDSIAKIVRADKVAGCIVATSGEVKRYRLLGATYFACHALRLMAGASTTFLEESRG